MQTRQPEKRVNWIFVVLLIIVIPLLIFIVILLNTVQESTDESMDGPDTTRIEAITPENLE
jgi:hypothetical protein